MMRQTRWVLLLLVLLPLLLMAWLTLTQQGLLWIYHQAQLQVPGELNVDSLRGRLFGDIDINGLSYSDQGLDVKSRQIHLEWRPAKLLFAEADITQLHITGLQIELSEAEKTSSEVEITLPWHISLQDVQIDELAIHQGAKVTQIDQVKANISAELNVIYIQQLEILAQQNELSMLGHINLSGLFAHDFKYEAQTILDSADKIRVKGRLKGDSAKTQVTQQILGPSKLDIKADVFNLIQNPTWQAKLVAKSLDSKDWKLKLPEFKGRLNMSASGDLQSASLNGNLSGSRLDTGPFKADFILKWLPQKVLEIEQLIVQIEATSSRVEAYGEWKPGDDGGAIQMVADWQNLRWPLTQEAVVSSVRGHGNIEGITNDFRFMVATDRPLPQLPASEWQASGTGNLQGLQIEQLVIKTLQGEINANGTVGWSEKLSWQSDIQATGINPASLNAQWPGQLNAHITSKGEYEDGDVSTSVDVQKLDGVLRGYPVALNTQLDWQNQQLSIKKLVLNSGKSSFIANGILNQHWKLDWQVDSSNLAELYPDAQGSLKATGQLTGNREKPEVNANVDARSLSVLGYQAGSLKGIVSLDMSKLALSNVDLVANSISYQAHQLDVLSLNGNAQKLQIKADSKQFSANVLLQGVLLEQGWQGKIHKADLDFKEFDTWSLSQATGILFKDQLLSIDQACWKSGAEAAFCANLDQHKTGWASKLSLQHMPLASFKDLIPGDSIMDGMVNAQSSLTLESGKLQGEALIDLLAGSITYPALDEELKQMDYRSGLIKLSINPEGLQTELDIKLNEREHIEASFSMPGVNLLTLNADRQVIKGQAQLTMQDLNFLTTVIPEIQDLKGLLNLNLAISGVLNQPRIIGQVELTKAALNIPRLGLNISQVEFKGQSEGLDKFNYQLSGYSGDGMLQVKGSTLLEKKSGWLTQLSVEGENFEVSHIPEASVTASPKLTITIKPYHIEVNGKVIIPYAHIEPRDFSTAAGVSSDVVIIGQEQEHEKKWQLVSRVQLILGDRVHFLGYGFEGKLGGNLQINDDPRLPTRASGEINIAEGRYRAYGQRLDIEKGRLLFSGGPLTRPGLDINAVRRVNTITVGIRARGDINEPVIELFSMPAMGETEILSYLLLGRPLEDASDKEGAMMAKAALALGLSGGDRLARSLRDKFGLDELRVESNEEGDQASLVVGRYLSPRLYVSYGIGLIEAFNTLIVRYQISEKWQLKAESGDSESADLIYTIER
jgi:translocation and assembly module TamB